MKLLIKLFFISCIGISQQINWENKPGPITAIEIYCDTEGIPIYVDGVKIGISPITQAVQVAPGWHQVSYFPKEMKINSGSNYQDQKINDLIKLARQDILVDEGKTVRAVLSYRTIESEVMEYERKVNSGQFFRTAITLILLFLIGWGLV